MVAEEGVKTSNVEATAYISGVAILALVSLVAALLLRRRRARATPACSDNAHFDVQPKANPFPEHLYAFEASDCDDGPHLTIQQDKDDVGCHYEEKNENASLETKVEVPLVDTVLRGPLRETRISGVGPYTQGRKGSAPSCGPKYQDFSPYEDPRRGSFVPIAESRRSDHAHTLETQSSVESDVLAHNDASGLYEEASQSRGTLELSVLYDAPVRAMTVHVLQARGLPTPSAPPTALPAPSPLALHTQVRVVLLPLKKQKYKSKIRVGENPQYMESYVFHKINPEDVYSLGLRVRVYGCERMRRQRLLGEAVLSFASLNLEVDNCLWLALAPRARPLPEPQMPMGRLESNQWAVVALSPGPGGPAGARGDAASLARSDSASSCCSARAAPELLLGLQYNAATGHLSVEIIKGTHFRKLARGAGAGGSSSPDTYVKVCLVSALGGLLARAKSSTRRAQSNPLYKELFVFQVALFQLSEVTLSVSVWWRRSVRRNEMVGWFALGHGASGPAERRHWCDLCESHDTQIQRWHVLLDS